MAIEYINEETGEIRAAPGARCWVVRPNKPSPGVYTPSHLPGDHSEQIKADIELQAEAQRWGGIDKP